MTRPPQSDTSHLLSLGQFVQQTNSQGGATLHANSGRLLRGPVWDDHGNVTQHGEPGVMVGGEPDSGGRKIPMIEAPSPLRAVDAHSAWVKTQILTGGRKNAHLGSWVNEEGKVELDTSGAYGVRTGKKLMEERNEKAAFNHKTGETYYNKNYRLA